MNKFLLSIGVAALLATSIGAEAQTNPVTTITGTGVNTNTAAPTNTQWTLTSFFSGGWAQAGEDAISFIEDTTNNGIVQVEGGALIGEKTHKIGGFMDVMLPIGGTNSLFGAGFGIAYYNGNAYDSTLNARLGDTFTLPLIKIPVYAYLESGGGYDISQQKVIAQAFTGFTIPIPITANQTLTLGAAIGTVSDIDESVLAVGASYTFKW